jgi:uncharacterized protein YcbX
MGEVDQLVLHERGVVDDRIFFLVDDAHQSLNQARRLPLCQATAAFDGEILSIVLPDGSLVVGETPTGERFTAGFDMQSTIEATLVPGPWRDALSGWAGEPVRLARAADGRGGWSGFAASLIGTPTIDALGLGPIDPRRFRMMIQTAGGAPFEEDAWVGRDVRVGDAVVRVVEECIRCAVTTVDPDTGERDVDALRAMITAKGAANLGVYCDVITPGTIRLGDPVAPL